MKIYFNYILFIFALFFFYAKSLNALNYPINISGNKFIDQEVVISLIVSLPDDLENVDQADIIEQLNNTGYFKNIEITKFNNSLNIKLEEYPLFKNVEFKKNKRFKKDALLKIFRETNEYNIYNEYNINKTLDQYYNLYKSFGYNSVNIDYEAINNDNNETDIYFTINEGKISKIRNINFYGNSSFSKGKLMNQIKSRERSFLKFIYNSNFKINVLDNDKIRLLNYYQNNGFKDVNINIKYEFESNSNFFDVYFNINEGPKFFIKEINLNTKLKDFNDDQIESLNKIIDNNFIINEKKSKNIYDEKLLLEIKKELADYIFNQGLYFFEISLMEKANNEYVSVLFDIRPVDPLYVQNIEIIGNTRTKDEVIRRELEFAEGDAINNILLNKSNNKVNKLGLFSKVNIDKNADGTVLVQVEEKSTGTFQLGLGYSSYDGASFIAELKEKNFQGSGREFNFTFNNSSDRSKYKLGVVEPHFANRDLNLLYNIEFSQNDLSVKSSYKYDNFNTEVGLNYNLSEDLSHTITLGYSLKDYEITDESNVSSSILDLSGANAQFLLNNILVLNKLDSMIKPTEGNYTRFTNIFSPITNSSNGFVKNTLNFRNYYSTGTNIYSFQTLVGNISSLQNETIDNSDKFSLGGRWLRGYDNYGAGPRDSRTSYIGGNNLAVAKFDLLRPLDKFSDNPIYLNLFTDIGKVWSNKTEPTQNKESVRSSYGFGLNYYSPIGPIGFTWGFPINDEPEDIKKMFTFSIGYLN